MKIKLKHIWTMFSHNWCPRCAKVTNMKPHEGIRLPGIPRKVCPECLLLCQSNHLENGEDEVNFPDEYTLPTIGDINP